MIRRTTFVLVSLFCIFFYQKETFAKAEEVAPVNYDQLLPIAKKYIGVPYAWGGSSPSGFDCSGYISFVYKQLNIDLPRISKDMAKVGDPIKRSELRVGDLVFFNTYGSDISHAGIYIGNNQFIHSQNGKGVSISALNDPFYWSNRYVGASRVLDFPLDVGQFQDVKKSHWAYEAVQKLSKKELIVGYKGSIFLPEEKITRAEMAAMLAESLNLKIANRSKLFKDVPSDYWAVGAINALYKEGIISGDNFGNFNPDGVVKREHIAVIFNNAFKLRTSPTATKDLNFTDVSRDNPAYEAIQKLAASGVASGYEDNTFKPREDVKRSQYVAFLYRVLN
jgi:murein DD-endopeptidase / murein LD-carboxypeptidase